MTRVRNSPILNPKSVLMRSDQFGEEFGWIRMVRQKANSDHSSDRFWLEITSEPDFGWVPHKWTVLFFFWQEMLLHDEFGSILTRVNKVLTASDQFWSSFYTFWSKIIVSWQASHYSTSILSKMGGWKRCRKSQNLRRRVQYLQLSAGDCELLWTVYVWSILGPRFECFASFCP